MPSDHIDVGTMVRLKSGGPKMTVTHLHDNGKALCTWFDDKHTNQSASFPIVALEVLKVDPGFA